MRTASLLCVLLLAKLGVLLGREVPVSGWTPLAYVWQDLLLVLLFALVDALTRRWSWVGWTLYGTLVLYAAVNVPIARVLSTPLTYPMFRAAGPALGDSITHYATGLNLGLLAAVVVAGGLLPLLFRRVQLRQVAFGAAVALPVVIVGPFATAQVETLGLHRNAVVAVVVSAFPRLAAATDAPPQAEPLGNPAATVELSRYRGAAAGRSVILIILESAAAAYLRPYGAGEDPMPNLTRLASEGVLFENAYAVYPESIKGLFALLCARRYPAMDTEPEQYEVIKTPSLAAVLQKQGYRTALFHSGRFRYLGMESIIRGRGYDVLEDAGDIGGNHNSSFGIDEPSTVGRLLGWLDRQPRGQRCFITYLPVAGHHPYETPEPGPFPDREEIDRYRNAEHYADASVGALLTGLRERGLEQETLVVVIGDHGQAFGQHPGNFGHTLFIYEENVHVPLIIAATGALGPMRVKRMASEVDLAPTVLDLLGLQAPEDYQGRSLLGERDDTALFFTDYSLGLLGLRDGDWKFIHEVGGGRSKLYDLAADPAERHSVAEEHPKQVTRYRDYLLRWAAAQRGLVTQRP